MLSVDAHSVRDLGYLRNAVTVARRGWVRRGQVLNTLGAEEFRRAVRPVGVTGPRLAPKGRSSRA